MRLRIEIFPRDLDATVRFYGEVFDFAIERDERGSEQPYVALRRDDVLIGAASRPEPIDPGSRRPPVGVEIVLEVSDVVAERDRVAGAAWPIEDELRSQPWGLRDFRVLDPDGYYLRITEALPLVE